MLLRRGVKSETEPMKLMEDEVTLMLADKRLF